ncbi:MAG TPA: hypothetical protein P5250_07360, partial [Bacteroidales bacterium]|nr:hypothetical protein [Bacteroidales bacterium]
GGSFWNNKINLPHKLMLIILGSVILISTVFINKHYKKTHFTDFKGAAFKIKHIEKIYGENNICKVFNINDPYYIMYYIGNDTLGVKKWYIQTENDFKELANIVDNCNKSFFMYVRLRPSNNIINDIINARYPYLIEYQKFDNYSDVYLYSKVLLKSSYNNEAPQMVFGNGFEGNNRWKGELMFVDTICYKGALGLKLKPQDEYSPTWSVNIDTLPVLKKIKYIKAETYVLSGKAGDLQLVISVEDNEGRLVKWSSCKFDYFVTPNKWSKIIHTVNVTLNKGEIIKVYIWNPSGEKAYIDDFSISIY